MKKSLISMLLVFSLLFSLSITAFADESGIQNDDGLLITVEGGGINLMSISENEPYLWKELYLVAEETNEDGTIASLGATESVTADYVDKLSVFIEADKVKTSGSLTQYSVSVYTYTMGAMLVKSFSATVDFGDDTQERSSASLSSPASSAWIYYTNHWYSAGTYYLTIPNFTLTVCDMVSPSVGISYGIDYTKEKITVT